MKNLTVDMIPELLKLIDDDQLRRAGLFRHRGKSTFEKWVAAQKPDVIEQTPWMPWPCEVIAVDEYGCHVCGSRDCAHFKNSAAMCPGPAP